MADHPPNWAVMSPATGRFLVDAVDDAWAHLVGGRADRDLQKWSVVQGTQDHTAIVDYNPGSEDILDLALIRRLSRAFDGSHYLLNLREEGTRIAVYEAGRREKWLRQDAQELAAELGIRLPSDDDDELPVDTSLYGIIVVEGATPEQVAAAITSGAEPVRVALERGPFGCLVYPAEGAGPPPLIAPLLGRMLPGARIYTMLSKPAEGRFHVSVDQASTVLGTFDVPMPSVTGPSLMPVLRHIKGETEPLHILRAMGANPARMGLAGPPDHLRDDVWDEDDPTWRADDTPYTEADDDWLADEPTWASEGDEEPVVD